MVLKEAYRYQNFLTELISAAQAYLWKPDFITVQTQNHNKNKVNPDAENEIITVQDVEADFTPKQVIDFLVKAIAEKEKLANAIAEAKKTAAIDIDSSVSMNKVKQTYINILKNMAARKSSQVESQGTDYKFDVNGEQKSYRYPVVTVTEINYDRNNVRNLYKKYQKETDETSMKLDEIQISTIVDFVPEWDISDTFEEIVTR